MSARRALLVANPTATTTTPQARALIEAAFSPFVELTVAYTEGRGHGMELARAAMRDGVDVVLALGGDGTVNEVVNGLLADTDPASPGDPATRPLLGVIPGGFANVVARALGLSADPLQAAAQVLHALRHDSIRELSIAHLQWQPAHGSAAQPPSPDGRWVCFSAGMGLDAEVIAAMEEQRRAGRAATQARYAQILVRQWLRAADDSSRSLSVKLGRGAPAVEAFLAVIALTSPWTYVGPIPIDPFPQASYEHGLDAMAVTDLRVRAVTALAARMLAGTGVDGLAGVHCGHDLGQARVTATRPTPVQVDGDLLGQADWAAVTSTPRAIRVLAPAA